MVGKRISKRNPPHSLPTQVFFFNHSILIIYIEKMVGVGFFSRGGTVSGSIGGKETPQANPYGVILTVYMVI